MHDLATWFVFDFIITLWQIQVALIFFKKNFIFFLFFIEIPAHDTAHCMHSQYRFNAECDF